MAKNTVTLARKIKLHIVGDKDEVDRVYQYIRNGQYAQYRAMNVLMGQLIGKYYEYDRDIEADGFKKAQKEILCNSNPVLNNFDFATGCDTKSLIKNKVNQDFSTALKNGLAKGERSATNYKRTYPLMTRGKDLKIMHGYESYTDFLEHINDEDLKVYVKWVNKITFEIVFGNPHRSEELRKVVKADFGRKLYNRRFIN